ncbi:unnamed protein product [Dibothriocephalus latus]|uniref:Uncharacterized protein n=1 Tax=Dibothriocephalus latus TaxID=60516 RepID=A0A3P7QSP8_DIBLA|nr:unnamed protein product [Dibothriocephalus latus]
MLPPSPKQSSCALKSKAVSELSILDNFSQLPPPPPPPPPPPSPPPPLFWSDLTSRPNGDALKIHCDETQEVDLPLRGGGDSPQVQPELPMELAVSKGTQSTCTQTELVVDSEDEIILTPSTSTGMSAFQLFNVNRLIDHLF